MLVTMLLLLAQDITPTHVQNVERTAPAVRDLLDAQLFDYPTARFRDVRVTANPVAEAESGRTSGHLCGYVNSKNRMGAYVGWQQFLATGTDLYIEGDRMADIVLPSACGRRTITDGVDRTEWVTYR
jgi:hypothetical protein